MRQRALDLDRLTRTADRDAALQEHAQAVDQRGRKLAEIGDRALPHTACLAVALAQEHRWGRPSVRDHVDEHGSSESRHESRRKPFVWTRSDRQFSNETLADN